MQSSGYHEYEIIRAAAFAKNDFFKRKPFSPQELTNSRGAIQALSPMPGRLANPLWDEVVVAG